jgi:ABC-type protease/lipase transport system fused ATPase/permease subunit
LTAGRAGLFPHVVFRDVVFRDVVFPQASETKDARCAACVVRGGRDALPVFVTTFRNKCLVCIELAGPVQIARPFAGEVRSDAAQAAGAFAGGPERRGGPARRSEDCLSGRNITLAAGKALGVIGPTASGKSSLARMLVGVWRPARGTVRLDGATLDQWSSEALGRHVGYVPQDVELFNGTVAQNICRFEDPPDPDAVIAAAQAAGVHDLIINLPEGYDTVIGEHGSALSAGQAQRIALARALYRDPFLVVLDEPNSNLDAEGDEALTRAILGLRARGAITVVIAHRPSAIAGVDYILVMAKGRQQQFGPKEEILSRVVPATTAPRPLKVAEQGGGA